jgi:hypothetical protein
MGRFYAWTVAGTCKRITVYGKTRKETAARMREAQTAMSVVSRPRTGPGSWPNGSITGWQTWCCRIGARPRTGCMR